MVAGKKDAYLYAVRHWICVSCLECPLPCLGGAGINLELSTMTAVDELEEHGESGDFSAML